MIWVAIALYLLGALSVQLWQWETGETHLLTFRWFMIGLLWWLWPLAITLDALLAAIRDLQRKEPPDDA